MDEGLSHQRHHAATADSIAGRHQLQPGQMAHGSIAMPIQQQIQSLAAGSIAMPRQVQQLDKVHTDASADEVAGGCSSAAQQPQYVLMSPSATPLVAVSRQLIKINNQLLLAARTNAPLVITGEPGLNTLKLAAMVHAIALEATTRESQHQPLVVVDCATAAGQAATQLLLNGSGLLCSSLLRKLLRGTLVLNHVHQAPLALLQAIDAATATLSQHAAKTSRPDQAQPAAAGASGPGAWLSGLATRLVVVSQRPLAQLLEQLSGTAAPAVAVLSSAAACSGSCSCATAPEGASTGCGGAETAGAASSGRCVPSPSSSGPGALPGGLAKAMLVAVPALRHRSSDIAPLAVAAGMGIAWQRGYSAVSLTPAAIQQLTSYAFPGNEAELKGLVKRAVMLHPLADSSSGCPSLTLDADDFWSATQAADRARLDALEVFPWIRTLLLDTGIWPHGLNAITKWLYPLLVAALFLGPQDRQHSAALTVFWAGWWPLVFLSFPFVGRAWCSICPFMVTGEEAQHIVDKEHGQPAVAASAPGMMAAQAASAAPPAAAAGTPLQQQVARDRGWGWKLQKWPAEQLAAWGGWFVAAGFALILVWEEVDALPDSAALSGWLLMLITGGAVACSMVYEKRLWCRHLCPVGGMNGLMAKMSMTEVRSRPGICAAAACSRPCHNGRQVTIPAAAVASPAAAEPSGRRSLNLAGQAAARLGLLKPPAAAETSSQVKQLPGCPMNTSPGKNQDNANCINCLNCLSSCAADSAQLRLRPPAADLWGDHSSSWSEVALLFVLLGAVGLHRLPDLCEQVGIPASAIMADTATHILASFAVLAAPGAIALAADRLAPAVQGLLSTDRKAVVPAAGTQLTALQDQSQAGRVSFLRMSYSLVPLVWAGTLAHYESLMLSELMLAWPRLLASLGIASEGPDVAWLLSVVPHIPPAPAAVVSAAQGCTLLLGTALGWALAGKIAECDVGASAAGAAAQGQRLLILLAAWELWQLVL